MAEQSSRRSVAVVGAGPAGMTAALLLGRAGHQVTLFERAAEAGGLWASQRDADGFFLGDNSCKVFQASYTTTPALLALLGTDWREHFVPRFDLTTDWLRPFVKDSTARDLALLTSAFFLQVGGVRSLHEISVGEFVATAGVSEECQAWLRATALGGIAGTLRMTMWELFHRIRTNVDGILLGASGPLYWNARPPNAPGGFLTLWTQALREAGVVLRFGEDVASLELGPGGTLRLSQSSADVVLLAVPPPALAALLARSDEAVSRGLGGSRDELARLLAVSRYEHLGITWFFDRPLPNDLPLGGHNVRRGWHPILVQHDQYRPFLRPPAVTAVVGSVTMDTDLRHQHLGTRADAHTPEVLARILWDDERAIDPSLPEPIGFHLAGRSAATQIVGAGPLPLRARGVPVVLASNLHGRAPYFTASLESAIQAGALAAQEVDGAVERLPMGAPRPLPWAQRSATRRLELVTELPCTAHEAWQVFLDTARWSRWSRFVVALEGELRAGARWQVDLQDPEGKRTRLRPHLLSFDAPRELRFVSRLVSSWAVRMEHGFVFEDLGHGRSRLRQPFEVSGAMVRPLWSQLEPAMTRFEQVGVELAAFLSRPAQPTAAVG